MKPKYDERYYELSEIYAKHKKVSGRVISINYYRQIIIDLLFFIANTVVAILGEIEK